VLINSIRKNTDAARETLDYVRRDLTSPDGGFFSAEDADSLPAGAAAGARTVEGAFYTWTDEEIGERLGADADLFRLRYGIERDGNVPFDPHGEFGRTNVLRIARSEDEVARLVGCQTSEVRDRLVGARARLFEARQSRPRPALDDKIITAWNGLMIAAFARGARLLAALNPEADAAAVRADLLVPAQRAAAFARSRLWEPDQRGLLRRFRDGESAVSAFAEDYTALIFGLLELFQADADPAWLDWALALQDRLDRRFWDAAAGGWFSTAGDDPSVRLRLKEDYDGAEPSATALGARNLLVLAPLTGRREY
jgi:uncharacterized protein YyaL (SSP411 family)